MNDGSLVLSLDASWRSDEADVEGSRITPELDVYRSAADAAAHREGIDISETLAGFGDLWFFASDGSPLQARFSQEPYFNWDRPTYFPGTYSLEPGTGDSLLDAIAKMTAKNGNSSPPTPIVVGVAATDEAVRQYGWLNAQAMKEGVESALQILPPDMRGRVMFARIPSTGELFLQIAEALR